MHRCEIGIATKLRDAAPQLCLGIIKCRVEVFAEGPVYQALTAKIDKLAEEIASTMNTEYIGTVPQIAASRSVYKALGKSPSKYRCSNEALLRRITQVKGLYRVNNVVDVNNLVSLVSKHSVGSYDLDQLHGDILFRVGAKEETYVGIGKSDVNLENMPVFCDQDGPYGGPTSDSIRAMITTKTKHIMMVIIAFSGKNDLVDHCNLATSALEDYCQASEIDYQIIEGDHDGC